MNRLVATGLILISFSFNLQALDWNNTELQTNDQEVKVKRHSRYCMTNNEINEFLWVKKHMYEWIYKKCKDEPLTRIRTEIATARALGFEPANWAKRDLVVYMENGKTFEAERDEIEKKYKVAQKHSQEVEQQIINNSTNENFNPLKMAAMYWSKSNRDAEPNNPYAQAINEERKIEHEREQIYHKYGKETPEEKFGGAIAILLTMGMLGAEETALSREGEFALKSLGKAQKALAVGESGEAFSSIMNARAALIDAEYDAALCAVENAKTAIKAGASEEALSAVNKAQSALSSVLKTNPSAALVYSAMLKAETKLDSAEKADDYIGFTDRVKINHYNNFEVHQEFIAEDLNTAMYYVDQYKDLINKGKIVQTKSGDICLCEFKKPPSYSIKSTNNSTPKPNSTYNSTLKPNPTYNSTPKANPTYNSTPNPNPRYNSTPKANQIYYYSPRPKRHIVKPNPTYNSTPKANQLYYYSPRPKRHIVKPNPRYNSTPRANQIYYYSPRPKRYIVKPNPTYNSTPKLKKTTNGQAD